MKNHQRRNLEGVAAIYPVEAISDKRLKHSDIFTLAAIGSYICYEEQQVLPVSWLANQIGFTTCKVQDSLRRLCGAGYLSRIKHDGNLAFLMSAPTEDQFDYEWRGIGAHNDVIVLP